MEQVMERVGGLSVRCQGLVHLYKTFEGHDVVALQGVDLRVEAGERVAFLGPSGSGKSTLLTLFGGIQRPSAGRIFLGEEEISRMSERQLTKVRASRVSTMLQGATRNLLAYATATQNLRFSRAASADPDRALGDAELLRRVGLETKGDQVVSSMSGGERQRRARAGSITTPPHQLQADEPTSHHSHEDRHHKHEHIHGLGHDFGTTILVVTHQPEVAGSFPRTVTMRGGRVGMEGRAGAEYVVVGAEGVVHLPAHIARDWPQGTLVRIEPEQVDKLLLSRSRGDDDEEAGA